MICIWHSLKFMNLRINHKQENFRINKSWILWLYGVYCLLNWSWPLWFTGFILLDHVAAPFQRLWLQLILNREMCDSTLLWQLKKIQQCSQNISSVCFKCVHNLVSSPAHAFTFFYLFFFLSTFYNSDMPSKYSLHYSTDTCILFFCHYKIVVFKCTYFQMSFIAAISFSWYDIPCHANNDALLCRH